MRARGLPLAVLLFAAGVSFAEAPARWVPEFCFDGASGDTTGKAGAKQLEARWNDAYRNGLEALEGGDLFRAQAEMCRALVAARDFDPRDWRFAETLDELGLIAFTASELDRADLVQGAAIAEMLLAVGPHGEPFEDTAPSKSAPIRPDCASGVRVYTERLGWIHDRADTRIDPSELEHAPWRIFGAGYLPLDAALADRLDWLVSRYLLEESFEAAAELGELQRSIRETSR